MVTFSFRGAKVRKIYLKIYQGQSYFNKVYSML
ncbi:hypothetical protein SAMN04487902_10796 [Prevotella sp. ne3005]|nr:hypothetical protein SAMN04487902_10796 [Prevotella sp. ne3005]